MTRTVEKHALVAFGGNVPFGKLSPDRTILAAIAAFAAEGMEVERVSKLYQTPCFPTGMGPDYINLCARVTLRKAMACGDILQALHRIEAVFGRQRVQRWGMRTLDIDLLALGDSVFPDLAVQSRWRDLSAADQAGLVPGELILPHPRLQDRAFVLVPLADVAPDWVHPVLGVSVLEMLAALPAEERAAVVAIGPAASA